LSSTPYTARHTTGLVRRELFEERGVHTDAINQALPLYDGASGRKRTRAPRPSSGVSRVLIMRIRRALAAAVVPDDAKDLAALSEKLT